MRLETASVCSSSLTPFVKMDVPIVDVQQARCHVVKNQNNSSSILKKNSSDFTSISLSQQTAGKVFEQSVSPSNNNVLANEYNAFSVKEPIACPEMVQGSSVVTPPPQIKTLAIETPTNSLPKRSTSGRLNKFVRRLHEMLLLEQSSGIVEWRKGLLVLHSTDAFTKKILPKYFGTKNFKTFRRQLNYYGFVHVRSFSATGSTTTALWVNQDLAKRGTNSIASVLMLKRVEPSESSKTAEGRRVRKEEAASTVEDIGINTRTIQLEQIRNLAAQGLEKRHQNEQIQSINSNVNLVLPVSIPSSQNCQESQTGTESTSSNTSSKRLSTTSSPVPASIEIIDITVPYANSSPNLLACATTQAKNLTVDISDASTKKHSVLVSETSTDDAANLLMMFSRSTFQLKT